MQQRELPFIDIGFDILAYYCGINTYDLDHKSFERIKYSAESPIVLAGIKGFAQYLN